MPPILRRFTLSWQILAAIVLALAVPASMGREGSFVVVVCLLVELCHCAGGAFFALMQGLAVPLIIAGCVEGFVGLEAMRGAGRVGWKTFACFAGCSVLALLTGGILETVYHLGAFLDGLLPDGTSYYASWLEPRAEWEAYYSFDIFSPAFWPALVLGSLGFGFYRNQIGEGRSHVILRFWRGVDDAVRLMLAWVRRLAPFGVFAVVFALWHGSDAPRLGDSEFFRPLAAVTACWAVYAGVLLPAIVWAAARVNPWQLARSLAPAILLALGSGSVPAALPLAFEGVRRRTGISARVANVIFPLGAAFGRDGAALGWTMLALYFFGHGTRMPRDVRGTVEVVLIIWGSVSLSGPFGRLAMPLTFLTRLLSHSREALIGPEAVLLFAVWISRGGAAVSLWSQACIAAIVARWEGERDLLTPRPPDDPLFGERLSKDFV